MGNSWESFRWRLRLTQWRIESRIGTICAVIAVLALAAATLWAPAWTLEFEKVLAWPVAALIALIVLRRPLSGLVEGQALRKIGVGPGGVTGEFEQREEAFDPTQLASEEAPAELDSDVAILLLANLAQAYQMQIDFLRYVQHAADGLTHEATHDWFRPVLERHPVTAEWDVEPLLMWLIDRSLLTLREDGRYILGPLGSDFIAAAQSVWYAPKAV